MLPADIPSRLRLIRALIDCTDAGLLLLWSGRRRLAGRAAGVKRAAGLPLRDRHREAEVHRRAQQLSRRLALPPQQVETICELLIDDACRMQCSRDEPPQASEKTMCPECPMSAESPISQQVTMCCAPPTEPSPMPRMQTRPNSIADGDDAPPTRRWLRLLPPPSRLAPWLRHLPGPLHGRLLQTVLQHTLARALAEQRLDALRGRRIGIRVSDLDLGWTLTIDSAVVQVEAGIGDAESVVHGAATDLLLLASRLQDADTLFFKRQLRLTGDVELGLTARNLLDQLPFDTLPLALRILLHRAARLARSARQAYSDGT